MNRSPHHPVARDSFVRGKLSLGLAPAIVLAALLAVGWAVWPGVQDAAVTTVPVSAEVEAVPTPVAEAVVTAEVARELPEEPVSALLPANDLTDERLARYWGETVDTIQRLHFERSLDNEHLAIIPPSKFQRAVWRLSNPKASHPGEALKWRALRHRDENGKIAPNGLVNAIRQREAHTKRQGRGVIAGLPVGPDDLRPQAAANQRAGITPGGWTSIGPGNIGGRTRALLVDPANPNTYFLGSVAGGIWRSTNAGLSWTPLSGFSSNLAVSTMAFNPALPGAIYAGTGEGFYNIDAIQGAGIFVTLDNGNTWTQIPSTNNPNFYFVNRIAVSADGSTVLAATDTGLFRSTDAGQTWSTPTGGVGIRMLDADFHPTDSARCICSTDGGRVFVSTNGGAAFTASTGLSSTNGFFFERTEVCYATANPNTVYAAIDRANGTVFRSTDGGASFTQRTQFSYLSGQGWYNNIIWAGDPSNVDRVIVGGLDLWRSTDGAGSFQQISVWFQAPNSAHADHHFVCTPPTYNGTTDQTLLFGNDGGIYRGNNVFASNTWTELNNTLSITQFYGGAANPTTNVVYGGTQDNGTLRFTPGTNASENWTTPFGGDGGWCAADPTDPNYFYGEYVYLQIHRSTNGGASASFIDTGIGDAGFNANFIAPFVLDPSNPNRLLAGGARLWRSNNVKAGFPTWAAIKPIAADYISAIAVNPKNSDQVWVGHNNGDLYYAANATATTPTWVKMDGTTLPNRYLERIAVDPKDGKIVYVSFGGFSTGNLWKTTNTGSTWGNIHGTLPSAPINGLAIHPTNTTWLYAGTEVGVYASDNSGTSWSPTNEGPVNVSVDELFFTQGKLTAVTHGRGMFQITPSTSGGGGPNSVTATYNSGTKTLTLTGDGLANSFNVTKQGSKLTLSGGNGTKINNLSTVKFTIGTAPINITGNLGAGNDSVSINSVPIATIDLNLGDGNDTLVLNYCTVATSQVDGGAGTDSFVKTTSTVTTNLNTNIP
jgi:photosystem II stability/assembly factor-like uncharacterized protein